MPIKHVWLAARQRACVQLHTPALMIRLGMWHQVMLICCCTNVMTCSHHCSWLCISTICTGFSSARQRGQGLSVTNDTEYNPAGCWGCCILVGLVQAVLQSLGITVLQGFQGSSITGFLLCMHNCAITSWMLLPASGAAPVQWEHLKARHCCIADFSGTGMQRIRVSDTVASSGFSC